MIYCGREFDCPICQQPKDHAPSCQLLRMHFELDEIVINSPAFVHRHLERWAISIKKEETNHFTKDIVLSSSNEIEIMPAWVHDVLKQKAR